MRGKWRSRTGLAMQVCCDCQLQHVLRQATRTRLDTTTECTQIKRYRGGMSMEHILLRIAVGLSVLV